MMILGAFFLIWFSLGLIGSLVHWAQGIAKGDYLEITLVDVIGTVLLSAVMGAVLFVMALGDLPWWHLFGRVINKLESIVVFRFDNGKKK
jgi:hypothetical protein